MTGTHAQFRLATTAIIALVFVSAPLPAQEMPPPDTSVETVTPTADPLAPEPEATTSSATETTAEPAAAAPRSERTQERTTSTLRRQAAASPAPARAVSAPAAESSAAPAAPSVTPAEIAPVASALPPAPPVRVAPAESRLELMNRVLPIGAAIVLGLLAIAATLLLLRRRRRRAEWIEEQEAYAAAELPAEPVEPAPEPAFIAPPAALAPVAVAPRHDPVPSGPATALPEGFDVSRFGRHVQAAYRGPTPDNPSLSLKNRLRRASAMDQRERAMQAAGAEPAAPVPAPASGSFVTATPRARPADGGFMLSEDGPKAVVRRAHSEESAPSR